MKEKIIWDKQYNENNNFIRDKSNINSLTCLFFVQSIRYYKKYLNFLTENVKKALELHSKENAMI